MNFIAFRPQPVLTCVLVFFATTTGLPSGSVSAHEPARPASCDAPEYRQFDFWGGDWNAFEGGSAAPVARLRVDRLLDGCVLREDYEGADGHKGVSLSIYDASRKVWHQTWVTNRGELLVMEGAFQGGKMVLIGADRTQDGTQRQVRGSWKPEGDGVRETAVTSTDGGKTWKPWFDLMFRARK
jgi:hypothetical protein